MRGRIISTTAFGSMLAMAAPVQAQTPADEASNEIVVTALKREQSLQDVPASVTALSADDLAASGITSSFDLQQRVAGLSISFGNRETNVAIRGVSNNVRSIGSDPSNAVHINGIYLPQSSMVLTDLFDINRVEVLKGPQGTLYGRNATGGAINVIARAPEEGQSAEGLLGGGSFGLRRAQLAFNMGNETVAARIAGTYVKDDGYTKNLQNNTRLDAQDFRALRAQLAYKISPDLKLSLLVQTVRDNSSVGYGISTDPTFRKFPDNFYGLVVPAALQRTGPREIRVDSPVFSRRDSPVAGATIDWTIGNFAIKSISGLTRYDSNDALDYDFTGDRNEFFTSTTKVNSFSQELQITNRDKGPFQWTVGLFYYDDDGAQGIDWGVPFPFARASSASEGNAKAIFGQATYNFSDKFAVMVGARYNDEEKSGRTTNLLANPNTTANVSASFNSFTPQAQIQFRPADDVLIYAGVTKGFKSGGFNLLAAGPPTLYQPEEIVAYEGGVRTAFFNKRATINASVFHYDYTNLQLRTLVFSGTGGGAVATVSNAEGAKITGVELQTDFRIGAGFAFDLAGTYLDAKFGNYVSPSNNLVLTGTRLPLAPELSGTAGLTFTGDLFGGGVRVRGEYVYRTSIIFPLTLDAPNNFDRASHSVNATVRWTEPGKRFYVEVVGRNLGDYLTRVQRADVFFSGVYDSFAPPRTIEGRIGFNF
jgi:iron complex outermembrane recepter protein